MLLIGGGMVLVGVILAIVGLVKNNNLEAQFMSMLTSGNSNPGTGWIVFGVIVILIGAGLIYLQLKYNQKRD